MNNFRFLIVTVALAFVLAGCQSQPADQPGAVNTSVGKSELATATQPFPTQLAESLPTRLGDKPPEPTFVVPPTPLPIRDVQWLVDVLRSSQVITITSRDGDAQQMQVVVDQAGKERIIDAVEGHTQPDYGRTERMGPWPPHHPYPGYQVEVATSEGQASIFWSETPYFTIAFPNVSLEDWTRAEYRQPDSALWKALEELAPPPRYTPDNIRYLFHATELLSRWDGNEKQTADRAVILPIVAGLSSGTETDTAAPTDESKIVFTFVVDGKPYEVKVWDRMLSYNGADYETEVSYETMIRIIERNGVE